jgi:tetratricopeptide (TPR) repeat protein
MAFARIVPGYWILAIASAVTPVYAQTSQTAADNRSESYFNFSMGHLYAEMAGSYGNRGEYVNKAIDYYKQALKLDPASTVIAEELADFYLQAGQVERATEIASGLVKADPSSVNGHKLLARIYSRQAGDPEQGRVDQNMLKQALAEYQQVVKLDPKDTESLSMLARMYRVTRDEASAEKTYRQILAADPNDSDALTGLAALFADRGDLTNAINMLKQAVDKGGDPRTVVTLAEFYEQNRQYNEAADTWKAAIPLTNGNVRVRRAWAGDLYLAGRIDEALSAYKELAAEDPKTQEFELRLADIYERKHDYANAHAALDRAKAIANGPEVRYAEAQLLNSEGKTADAITMLEGLLKETRKNAYTDQERDARLGLLDSLARMQKSLNRTKDAIATFRQIPDLNSALASRVAVEVIDVYANAKDFKAARQEADAALKKFPGDRPVIFAHAGLLSTLAQYDQAINELRALPDSAEDRDVLVSIAQIQDKAKKFSDERKTLDAAEKLAKNDQDKLAITFMRGAMYEREKNFNSAEEAFRKIIDSDPTNAGALNYLGYMYADRNIKLDEAVKLISKALDLDPGNPAYLDSLGWAHFRQNQLDQAATELNEVLAKMANDPTIHDHLGEVYFKQGKYREATQQWQAAVDQMKTAAPAEQDPEELAKISKKLEGAKSKAK